MKNGKMRMKQVWLLALPLLFGACSYFKIKDDSFRLSVERIQSSQVWAEVVPNGNSYSYVCDVVKADEYHKYHKDRKFIEAHFEELKNSYVTLVELYDSLGVTAPSIENLLFNSGPYKSAYSGLDPETDYYFCLYCLDSKQKPIHKLLKTAFTTPAKPHSNIDFSITVVPTNDTLIITPTNDDPYFWEVALKSTAFKSLSIDSVDANEVQEVLGSALIGYTWFSHVRSTYYSWGFDISGMTTRGEDRLSLYDTTVSLKEGDVLYVGCVGYEKEETGADVVYQLTYHTNQPAEVERMKDPFADIENDTTTNENATLIRALQKRNDTRAVRAVGSQKATNGAGLSIMRTRQFPR